MPGLDRVVEHRHLDEQPAHAPGREDGDLEGDVGPQRRAADDGLVGAEVVEQEHHLLGERGHGVDQRIGGPVGAAVAEEVEGHHVQTLGGQRAGQRLLHPARHQLAVQQDDPAVPAAVLGVLQAVASRVALDEELPDPLGDQSGGHERKSTRK